MPQMQSAWVDSGRSVDWGDVTRRALEAIKQLVPRSPRLSHDLSLRLKQVVASRTDDVLVRSATPEVAQRVEEMAVAVVEHGLPEPSILLAEDGSLGVDWRLPSGTTVGLFVGDIDAWEPVALITDDSIEEVEVHSVTELIDLLRKHT
ncbi:MAG: hypothetical protein O3B31_04830 [Chloroflexi bacterium]|nr:hypothetical protein [Chloroflexota bacterium]